MKLKLNGTFSTALKRLRNKVGFCVHSGVQNLCPLEIYLFSLHQSAIDTICSFVSLWIGLIKDSII